MNVKNGSFKQKVAAYFYSRRLSWIVGILFEGCSKYGEFLLGQVVIEFLINSQEEVFFSELVHLDDHVPIRGNLFKALALCQVDQG